MILEIPRNDVGYGLLFTVQNADGSVFNLTGYTVHLKMWHPNNPNILLLNREVSILDAAAGSCRYIIQTGDFSIVDTYNAELELSRLGIRESTVSFTIKVKESG